MSLAKQIGSIAGSPGRYYSKIASLIASWQILRALAFRRIVAAAYSFNLFIENLAAKRVAFIIALDR